MMQGQIDDLNRRMAAFEGQLRENTAATKDALEVAKRVETATSDIVESFQAAQGAFKVLAWMGKAAKPILWATSLITGTALAYESVKKFFAD